MYYYSYLDVLKNSNFNEQWQRWLPPTSGDKVSAFMMPITKQAKKMKNIDEYDNLIQITTLTVRNDTAGHKGMMYAIPICKVVGTDFPFFFPLLPVAVIENIAELPLVGLVTANQVQEMTYKFVQNLNAILDAVGITGNAFVFDESENLASKIARRCEIYINADAIHSKKAERPAYICGNVGRSIALAHFIALETYVLRNDESNVCHLMQKWMKQKGKGKFIPRLIQLVIKGRQVKNNLEEYNKENISHVDTIYPLVRRAWQNDKRYQIPIYEIKGPGENIFMMINTTPALTVLNKMLENRVLDEDNYNQSYASCLTELKTQIGSYTVPPDNMPLCKDKVILVEFDSEEHLNLDSVLYETTVNNVSNA
jgi:hypothetical protein